MGARLLVFFAVLLAAAGQTGCRKAGGPEPGAAPAPESGAPAAAPRVDAVLEPLFRRIAGLSGPRDETAAWQAEPAWTAFAAETGKAWAEFETGVLEPMRGWAAKDLREARRETRTVFYPFGGPDFATAFALFPEATETVLLGLEPVGNLPDLDRHDAAWREAFFADLGGLATEFLTHGYFITKMMNDVFSRGKVDGALPVIAFFLERGGCAVADVRRLAPAPGGDWTETPYEKLAARPRRPYGVRIVYLKPGETVARSVCYFSCDVENKAFQADGLLCRRLAGLERVSTFVKSGSYLLHWSNFSTLRRLILDRSLYVLEDDTGVPYRFFKDGGWTVRLFGRYASPVKDFTNVEQPDLRAAYEDPASSVAPLPFHFGYRWRSQIDNLLMAQRPRRSYKAPVRR